MPLIPCCWWIEHVQGAEHIYYYDAKGGEEYETE
jgi:hypothetical protein